MNAQIRIWVRAVPLLLAPAIVMGQTSAAPVSSPKQPQAAAGAQGAGNSQAAHPEASTTLIIPEGAKVPVSLKQAISTKTAKEGDPVYAITDFPFVLNDRIIIPAGTYVQGRIAHVQRAGRVKGRAEILIHFTSLIYPSGYTVMLGGSLENVPGAEHTSVKDSEGTVRQDSDTMKKVGTVASTASTGAVIGGLSAGGKGAGIGAAAGGVAGMAIAMLTRGNDVRLEPGTSIEMVIQREVTVDATRMQAAK
jgi:type IV secretion system protein VirB10